MPMSAKFISKYLNTISSSPITKDGRRLFSVAKYAPDIRCKGTIFTKFMNKLFPVTNCEIWSVAKKKKVVYNELVSWILQNGFLLYFSCHNMREATK